jgi:hypothetical protein
VCSCCRWAPTLRARAGLAGLGAVLVSAPLYVRKPHEYVSNSPGIRLYFLLSAYVPLTPLAPPSDECKSNGKNTARVALAAAVGTAL